MQIVSALLGAATGYLILDDGARERFLYGDNVILITDKGAKHYRSYKRAYERWMK